MCQESLAHPPGWRGSPLCHPPLCMVLSVPSWGFAVIVMNSQIYFWLKRPRTDVCQRCGGIANCPGLLTEVVSVNKEWPTWESYRHASPQLMGPQTVRLFVESQV